MTCTDPTHDCTDPEGSVIISVSYTRLMLLPYLKGKYLTLHFAPSATESLQPVEW